MTDCRNIWSEAMTLTLLDAYRASEHLWNAFHPNYTNKQRREEAYAGIIAALATSAVSLKDVKIKLKNLRSSYSGELKKIRDARLGGEKEYAPKVFWFNKMDAFLRDVVVPQPAMYNNDFQIPAIKEEYATSDPIASVPLCSKLVTKKRRAHPRDSRDRVKHIKKEPEEVVPDPPIESRVLPKYSDDEFDAFGRNIALQLKTLPLDIALQMQIRMQTMLAEVRLSYAAHRHRMEFAANGPHALYPEVDLSNQSDEQRDDS